MEVTEMVGRAAEGLGVRRVFSEPIQQDGSTVVLAAIVRGGGGSGEGGGENPEQGGTGHGSGGGFGFNAKPAGAFVIRNGEVTWQPAIDVNRIILGAQLVGAAALLFLRAVVRGRRRGLRKS